MTITRATLLHRVRDLRDEDAWREFCESYAPLIYRYARSLGIGHADAEEARDACFAILTQRMPAFDYDAHRGRFKTWLYQIVHGKVVDTLRRRSPARADTGMLQSIRDPGETAEEAFDRLWRERMLRECFERACAAVGARDARAFRLLLDGKHSVGEVGARLEMNANQVYKAKSRVLAKVRELMASLER